MGALTMSGVVLACAVCGAGEDPAQGSYVVMTLIISALPLLMLGGIVWWVATRVKRSDASPPNAMPHPRPWPHESRE